MENPKSPLAQRINSFHESQTIAYTQKARELKAQGKDVISLSVGEPDFQTPQYIKDAAKRALDEGYTQYPPVPGYPELREAISAKFKKDNNIEWPAANTIVSTGAKHSIANALQCLIDPGDEVVILAPFWVSYPAMVQLAGGIPVFVNGTIENEFKATATDIEKAITPKTKALLYSSPCNPTGAVFGEAELRAIGAVLERNPHVYAIADEIYELINFTEGYFSLGSIKSIAERVITVNGLSKGYAMTGWRLGYLGGPTWLVKAVDKLQGQFTSGACSIAQRAAITALTEPNTEAEKMRDAFKRRRDLALAGLNQIPNLKTPTPEGAFYLFPEVKSFYGKKTADGTVINTSDDMCMYLLNTVYVACVPGEAFGNPDCIRLSYATSDEKLVEAVKRIGKALSDLK